MKISDILSGLFRFIHITAGCFIIGNSISEVIWSGRNESEYSIAYIAFGLGLLVSGVVNVILLKPSSVMDKKERTVWSAFVYAKAALWVLFIPIPDLIADATGHSFPRNEFIAALVLAVLLLSVSAKTLRDWKSKKNPNF
jgi:drug/metabolite transporter (DMT)-like permease